MYKILFIIILFLVACQPEEIVESEDPVKPEEIVEYEEPIEPEELEPEDPVEPTKPEEPSLCERALEAWQSIEKYPYVWGGDTIRDGGFDCSGAIYFVQAQIGKPVPRTTSKKYNILAGGSPKHWQDGKCLDWIWWTFTPDRPYGHIGMHITNDIVWQSGSSTGPTETNMFTSSYWDGIFDESRSKQ